jgi:hypothetical protein
MDSDNTYEIRTLAKCNEIYQKHLHEVEYWKQLSHYLECENRELKRKLQDDGNKR